MQPWLLCLFCGLLGLAAAKPVSDHHDLKQLAANYAKRHPNLETEPNPEYGKLYQGDIMIKEEDDDVLPKFGPLNAVVDPALLWPNAVLYYNIVESGYDSSQLEKINNGIRDLENLTKVDGEYCIRLVQRTTQTNFVNVENYSGCSSYVGMIGGQQRLSLFVSSTSSCLRHGTIMHEFLHAYGYHHEQKRTDRDDWVTINWENIQPGYEHNFVKLNESMIQLLGTSYDYGSVMHYGAYAFAIDPNVPTIIPHDPDAVIGQRETLSALDIERVQILYGCLPPEKSVYYKHLDATKLPYVLRY